MNKKIIITATLAVVFLLITTATVLLWVYRESLMWNNSHSLQITSTSVDTSGVSGFAADALYLVETIERVHPIFIMDGYLPADYETKRDEFLLLSQEDITRRDFVFAAWRYVTALRDGHMTGLQLFTPPLENVLSGDLLYVSWFIQNEELFLKMPDGSLAKVREIGGIPPLEIFTLVDYFVYSENFVDRDRVRALHIRYRGFIELMGGEINNNTVVIRLEHDEIRATTASFVFLQQRAETPREEPEFIIRHEFIDDIFFIDFRMFVQDDGIDETIHAIEQAIESGTRKFIIDLRGNGGGDSRHGQRLLQAMGITIPSFGVVRRYSDLYMYNLNALGRLQVRLISPFARGQMFPPSTSNANNPNDVFISVLTDRATYSSATMLATWVQDGGFGNVIGGISSNAPSAFGDMLRFTLPYSEIGIRVSHARFLRPDKNADQTMLIPDILTDPELALDVAVDYLRTFAFLSSL